MTRDASAHYFRRWWPLLAGLIVQLACLGVAAGLLVGAGVRGRADLEAERARLEQLGARAEAARRMGGREPDFARELLGLRDQCQQLERILPAGARGGATGIAALACRAGYREARVVSSSTTRQAFKPADWGGEVAVLVERVELQTGGWHWLATLEGLRGVVRIVHVTAFEVADPLDPEALVVADVRTFTRAAAPSQENP